jgi:putative ABC transport system permease protein
MQGFNNLPMLKNFLRTAIRYFARNKAYAVLNIFGLSIGLGCFMLIALWVKDELGYDRFHGKADRIYRVSGIFTDESGTWDQAVTPVPLGPALIADLPEVEEAVRIDRNSNLVRSGDMQFIESGILGVDPSFFKVFDFKLLKGNPKTVLEAPYNVVVSESIARKYFGDRDPIGETLRIFQYDPDGSGADYKVTGVIQDCPSNSHFQYSMLFSFSTIAVYDRDAATNWFDNGYYTYALLKPATVTSELEAKFPAFLEKYIGKEMRTYRMQYDYFLTPLTDIHLRSNLRYEIMDNSSLAYVMIFGAIGVIVLLLACINYVNLSTAYSTDRFREVGVRKVMGAFRTQLVVQFLVESWLLALGAMLVSIGWIEVSRSFFEQLSGKPVTDLYSLPSLFTLFSIASAVGLASGLYPALVLSSLKPANILKGRFRGGSSGVWLRKSLVVLQYSVTIVLVSGILVVRMQLAYVKEKDLGFNEHNLLMMGVNGSREVFRGYEAFANEVLSHTEFSSITRSNTSLGGGLGNSTAVVENREGKKVNGTMYRFRVDHGYIDTYEMKLLAGRNFMAGSSYDSTRGFIVNETAVRQFGYLDPNDAIGKYFSMGGMDGEIIGVVKDYHYNSLQHAIAPAAFTLLRVGFSRISVRIAGDVTQGVGKLTAIWKRHFPESIVDFGLAEQGISNRYQSETRFSSIFLVFSFISMAIACLGLFALVSYDVDSRTKEIGIRKVLGASVAGIVSMLSREFLLLIVVSCVVAIPISIYFMEGWLEGFAYHTNLSPRVFVTGGLFTLLVAYITISFKAIRSALNNPVDALRSE